MFDAALEYRKFVQRTRTFDEKQKKLTALALHIKARESSMTMKEILNSIVSRYQKGKDLLDPDLFEREDLIEFARKNRIQKDPLMLSFIQRAMTREQWERTKASI